MDLVHDVHIREDSAALLELFTNAWIAWTTQNKLLFEEASPNVPRDGFRKLVVNYEAVWANRDEGVEGHWLK